MKKILILSLLALPALAAAEVHFYGDLKAGVEASNTQYGSHKISNNGVSDMGSYVGMRGSHPIGCAKCLWHRFSNPRAYLVRPATIHHCCRR